MADRGFSFPEYFAAKGVRLLIPASTRGKTQLSGQEVSVSRHMSRMMIHVEIAIGRIKIILYFATNTSHKLGQANIQRHGGYS